MDQGDEAPAVLNVAGLAKSFAGRPVIADVSFRVAKGEILGILGANGAGKSTLIGMISGLLAPDAGAVEIFGRRFAGNRAACLARMNLASPYAALPGALTVRQNLSIYAALYGVRQPGRRIDELLEQFGVAAQAGTRCAKLSSGQAIRVGLCKALLNRPDLLLLDEPTVYLDPEIAARARRLILREREARGMTILLTSHNLDEIDHLCDRVLLLDGGRAAALGSKLDVTRALLGQQREQASLGEVFARLAREGA
jgi:ABC-2 type transport system ATP-binding protein